ncbi:bifunctional folylpolyglutamate synthase/dihydrofolate synthase [Sphingobacterium mizutaii]|uniref:bifunctional folylpolyglutamate synthase/dihydrofolate synthase n=1 Tax=Sphingobacterium mizutaii TaxID=1010 RepID=UPI00289E2BC6|nr:folylpolyglutamate synthase/dihydrofolate synthase family protein [Sphingobacterium mizutaii]
MKTFAEVIEYLFARLPMFTRDGASAINPDVDKTLLLCQALGNPHQKFKSIHIAGTNGKGSSSHMLASVLAASKLKTGLYTSPHLVDFRERIRIDGKMIPEQLVVDFVNDHRELIEDLKPSFFEVTVAMAFDYFAKEKVDIAVIEVGLGGRLDSTNIILPELCLITNIGMDHMNILGDTMEQIAGEKAGIIKPHVPVVISEKQTEIEHVFINKAKEGDSPIFFAENYYEVHQVEKKQTGLDITVESKTTKECLTWQLDLSGSYQKKNILGVLTAIDQLKELGYELAEEDIREGLRNVQESTGLRGRWQTLSTDPWIICDTGHNEDGIKAVVRNLSTLNFNNLHFVIGAMKDKDLSHILPLLPKQATYYFAAPQMPRAMKAADLAELAHSFGLKGQEYAYIDEAYEATLKNYQEGDLIFIGGSTFVVAEVLTNHF